MAVRLLGVVSIIILARILTPGDYGIVAKAVMILALLELMSELGLETILIANQETTIDEYNTAWTLHICRGVILGTVLSALAVPASIYFKEPELSKIIYCYAAITVVGGFYNIGVVDFRKKLEFRLDFLYNLYKKVAAFLTTVSVAFIWQSYWALVAGVAVSTITMVIASFLMSAFRPKLCFNKWRELFHSAKWMMIHELATSLGEQIDKFLLGRFSTASLLGVYLVSTELAETPTAELAMSASRASTPSLAKYSNERQNMRLLYQKTLSMIVLVAAPTGVGISILSFELTNLLLGQKWLEAAPLIEVIAITGIFTLVASNFSALIIIGKVKILSLLSIFSLIFRTVAMIIGYVNGGVLGMVTGILISTIIYSFVSLSVQKFYKIFNFKEFFRLIWRGVISTLLMYVGLDVIKGYLSSSSYLDNLITIVVIVVSGILIYCSSLILLWVLSGKCDGSEKDILEFLIRKRKSES